MKKVWQGSLLISPPLGGLGGLTLTPWTGLLGVVLVILGLSLAGCGSPTEPPPTPAGEAEKAAPAAEQSIVIAIPEDPPSFNGLVTDTGYEQLVMEMVLLGLTDIDPDGNVFPELAAELPTLDNGGVVIDQEAGTMAVTWKVRPGVTWADGQPLTAGDVLFTWEAISNPETGIWMQGLDYIDRVEKVDDLTLVVHYNSIYPAYLTQFGGDQVVIWPSHYCAADQGFIAWDCNRQPLSSGPYKLETWETGDHLTFVRNPAYFEPGKPAIDRVTVRIVPEQPVRKTMLVKGDVDVVMWLSDTVARDLEGESGVKVSFGPTGRWVMRLVPNLAARGSLDPAAEPHPILSDPRVRQAIRRAIDVDTIAEKIFHGYPRVVWTEFFRPPYTCDIPRPAYDPDKAAALLEEAGWIDQDGDGIRECHGCLNAPDGYPMALEFGIYAEYGEELELSQQLIAEMLGKIGMELQMTMVQGSVLWADSASGGTEQNGNFELDMFDDGYSGIDPTDHLWFYYYSAAAEPDAGWNIGRWLNPEFDALLDQAYTLDEAERRKLFCQMAEILDRELPQILLFSTITADGHSARLEGVQSTANDIVSWNIADWKIVAR